MTEFEDVSCDICGSDDCILLHNFKNTVSTTPEFFKEVQCRKCGLIYIKNRPTRESIYKYYSEDYGPHMRPGSGSLVRKIHHLMLSYAPGYREIKKPHLLSRFFYFFEKGPAVPFKKGGKLLDAGCGNGEFVSFMREFGWDAQGIDISSRAVEKAREAGLPVSLGNIEKTDFQDDTFDVVTMRHVLEHIHSPTLALSEAHRILKPHGLLFFTVPNGESILRKIFAEDWPKWEIPIHLYTFSIPSLSHLLEKTNFKITSIYTYSLASRILTNWLDIKGGFMLYKKRRQEPLRKAFGYLQRLLLVSSLPTRYFLSKNNGREFETLITVFAEPIK